MKKLMISMLVLGLATVANAQLTGVQLSVDGVTNGPGNVTKVEVAGFPEVKIDVVGPDDYEYLGYIIIQGPPNSAGGEWGDTLGPPYTRESGYYNRTGYPIKYAAAGDLGSANRFTEWNYGDDNWGFGYEITADSSTGPLPGGKEFEFMFHIYTGLQYVTITLWDVAQGYSTPQDTILIWDVPEPMTITLLGLGGMALLRKRR